MMMLQALQLARQAERACGLTSLSARRQQGGESYGNATRAQPNCAAALPVSVSTFRHEHPPRRIGDLATLVEAVRAWCRHTDAERRPITGPSG